MKKEELDEFIEKLRRFDRNDFEYKKEYKQFLREHPEILKITELDYYRESERIDNFIEWIEDDIESLQEDIYDERYIIQCYLEELDAWTNDDWMFPNGREDD
jgi:hypothetical protein